MILSGIRTESAALPARCKPPEGRAVDLSEMTDLTRASDEDLLRRSARGDEDAFTALYRRRQPGVYRFALHMSGRPDLAEEVTQDVFITLIKDPARFDEGRGALGAFLLGVARNLVLRHIDRDRNYVFTDEEPDLEMESASDLLADLTREQAIQSVRQAVLTLPPTYREAIVLCDLEEMTYADAAGILAVPVGTVRSRLNRGRSLLLGKLKSKESGKGAVRCSA